MYGLASTSRRANFASGMAAIASLALRPPSALAQSVAGSTPPVIEPRSSGHYRFRVGEIRATVVRDGTLSGSPRLLAGNASAEELDRALWNALRSPENKVLNLNTLLLEVGGRTVLVEAGAAQTMGPDGGALFANLFAIGIRVEELDVIIVTHTHPNHVGNLRRADGAAAFPNAAVHVPEADWNFFVRCEPDLSRLPMPAEFRQRIIAAIKRSVEPIARTRSSTVRVSRSCRGSPP